MELFSPDSKSILFYEDGILNFRDVLSHQINHSIDLKAYHVDPEMFNYRFSPDGKQLLILQYDKAPFVLELATGKTLQIQIDGLEWALWGEFASDGKSVFVGGPYDWVYRWDLDKQSVIQKYYHQQWGFTHFAVTDDMKYLVGGGGWAEAGIWDVDTGDKLFKIPSKNVPPQLGTVLILPGENYALLCEGTGGLIIDIASGKIVEELVKAQDTSIGIFNAAVSHKTNILLSNSYDNTSTGDLWDARSFGHIRSLNLAKLPEDEWRVYVSISPDGAFAASISNGGNMYIWDLAKRSLLRSTKWDYHFISGG